MIHHLARNASRILSAACLLAAISATLQAQPDGPPPGGPPMGMEAEMPPPPNVDRDLKSLTRLLALTPDQQTQVKAILTEERAQIQAALKKNENEEPSQSAMSSTRTQIRSIRLGAESKIAALLNTDQAAKFAERQKKRAKSEAEEGDSMPPPPDGGPPPDMGGGPPGI
jgi:Spy/CpxP family protein refolding chaperone